MSRRRVMLRGCALSLLFCWPAARPSPRRRPPCCCTSPLPSLRGTTSTANGSILRPFSGRVVLLTFWATWCAPCQVEMPHFVRWQQELGPRGFQVVAISMDDDAAPVLNLTRKRNVNYPVIMGDEQLAGLYGEVLGLPVTFLIDRRGNIAAIFKGESNLGAMKARIVKLVDRDQGFAFRPGTQPR